MKLSGYSEPANKELFLKWTEVGTACEKRIKEKEKKTRHDSQNEGHNKLLDQAFWNQARSKN